MGEWDIENSSRHRITEKTQTEVKLEMKKIRKKTKTSEASLTYKTEEIQERLSAIDNQIEEMDTLGKESVKSKTPPKKIQKDLI